MRKHPEPGAKTPTTATGRIAAVPPPPRGGSIIVGESRGVDS